MTHRARALPGRRRRHALLTAIAAGVVLPFGAAWSEDTPAETMDRAPAAAPAGDDAQRARAAYQRGARAVRQGDAAAAVAQLAIAAELEPDDTQVLALYGQALLADGQPREAREALERARTLSPETKGLAYYAGLASYRLGDFETAARDLQTASTEQPESGIAALYLGIALSELGRADDARDALARAAEADPTLRGQAAYRTGLIEVDARDFDAAVAQFEIVEAAQPGSALARSARAYIDQIENGGLRRWSAYAQLGGGYDSNVSLGTDEVAGLGIESGFGEATLGGSLVLFERDRIELRAGQQAFINFHGGEPANDFDQIMSATWATASVDLLDQLEGQLGYTFQYIWAGYDGFRSTHVVEPALRLTTAGRFRTDLFYRMEARDYQFSLPPSLQALDRDGFVHRLGLDQYWQTPDWTGWGSGFVKLGVQLRLESTDGTENDARSVEPVATVGIPLPRDFFLTLDASYEWRDFDNVSIASDDPSGKTRFDWITQLGATLRIPIWGRLYGDARYRFTNRSSRVAFYRYDRHLTDFVLTYQY